VRATTQWIDAALRTNSATSSASIVGMPISPITPLRVVSPAATTPTSPVKQGGLATQQADAAAKDIAADAGADVVRDPLPDR
jgi:hypothetical protein